MFAALQPVMMHAPVAPAAAIASSSSAISHEELVRYAQAFLMVKELRNAGAARLATLPLEQRQSFENQLREQVSAILAHEDLTRARFNALSATIETDILVRQRLQQIILEQQIGT